MNTKKIRTAVVIGVILVISFGFVTSFGIGTLSAPGFGDISLLCPLGALTAMLASKIAIPRALVSLVIVVILIVVFARAFCAWVCPVPLVGKIRNLFSKGTGKGVSEPGAATASEKHAQCSSEQTESCSSGCSSCKAKRREAVDSRHIVLGGALLSAFIFGFPVFCFVCPIGLTFATILLVINLFTDGAVTWSLILIPAFLAIEVIFFKKWCHKICPLGAFMSLIGKANKTFVPTIDNEKCLETSKNAECGACGRACEEGIDIRHPQLSEAALSECTKCRACVDACPAEAVSMPLLPKKK